MKMKPKKQAVCWLLRRLDKRSIRRHVAAVSLKSRFSTSQKEFRHRVQRLRRSGLFDEVWYRKQTKAGADAIAHYLRKGAAKGFDPNPFFDSDWYLTQYPDVAAAAANPLEHYLLFGARERRDPHPGFSTDWYFARYPDAAAATMNPLQHFLTYGAEEGRMPDPTVGCDGFFSPVAGATDEKTSTLAQSLDHMVDETKVGANDSVAQMDESRTTEFNQQFMNRFPSLDGRDPRTPLTQAAPATSGRAAPAADRSRRRPRDDRRLGELLRILRCPVTGRRLIKLSEDTLVTDDGSHHWPLRLGRPVLFEGLGEPVVNDDDYLSNPLVPQAVELVKKTKGLVLNLSAGGSGEWFPNMVEVEAKNLQEYRRPRRYPCAALP